MQNIKISLLKLEDQILGHLLRSLDELHPHHSPTDRAVLPHRMSQRGPHQTFHPDRRLMRLVDSVHPTQRRWRTWWELTSLPFQRKCPHYWRDFIQFKGWSICCLLFPNGNLQKSFVTYWIVFVSNLSLTLSNAYQKYVFKKNWTLVLSGWRRVYLVQLTWPLFLSDCFRYLYVKFSIDFTEYLVYGALYRYCYRL